MNLATKMALTSIGCGVLLALGMGAGVWLAAFFREPDYTIQPLILLLQFAEYTIIGSFEYILYGILTFYCVGGAFAVMASTRASFLSLKGAFLLLFVSLALGVALGVEAAAFGKLPPAI